MKLLSPCTWVVTIPDWHPARLNELICTHWAKAAKRKKADRQLLFVYCHNQGVSKAKGKRRVEIEITLAPRQRAGDPDCYFKSACDGLVHCGAIKNDSHVWVELAPVKYLRGPAKSTTIRLTDI